MEINVVDAIMGAGKSTAAINYINASDDSKRFIYITPYRDEVDRIVEACKDKKFKQPIKYTKSRVCISPSGSMTAMLISAVITKLPESIAGPIPDTTIPEQNTIF